MGMYCVVKFKFLTVKSSIQCIGECFPIFRAPLSSIKLNVYILSCVTKISINVLNYLTLLVEIFLGPGTTCINYSNFILTTLVLRRFQKIYAPVVLPPQELIQSLSTIRNLVIFSSESRGRFFTLIN